MNSNFILSGLISVVLYLLVIFSLVVYFNLHYKTHTVGKKESFNVEVVSLEPPKPIVQKEKREISKKENPEPIKTTPNESLAPKSNPKASIADIFNQVAPSKKSTETEKKVQYQNSYTAQKFEKRSDVRIDSTKDVTISSVNKGDIDDPIIMEFQAFLYKRWNPPRSVGVHSTTLDVRVNKDGQIEYKILFNTSSSRFDAYVKEFVNYVAFFKPIQKELRIELILKTKE